MSEYHATPSYKFALTVVRRLREHGYQALFAGGCVRDMLVGREPKDFDVATNATPEQVRKCLGYRRTLAIGAAFGVVAVIGPRDVGSIDVATFRTDAEYLDGRRPSGVSFSTPEADAQRRDFTMNGLFYDPLEKEVIDYVGGENDIRARVVRAIGDPEQRIHEDKLRMLRGIRMAASYGFRCDPATLEAIARHSVEIKVVSAERVAAEMRRMLAHESRARSLELLHETGLLSAILPDDVPCKLSEGEWSLVLHSLDNLRQPLFETSLICLLKACAGEAQGGAVASLKRSVESVAAHWRLSNEEKKRMLWMADQASHIHDALEIPWPRLQRTLIEPDCEQLLMWCEVERAAHELDLSPIQHCRRQLQLPSEILNPPALLSGNDLRSAGFTPGPEFRTVLEQVRDAQLDGQITTSEQALELARTLFEKP